jgi:hypothetical protein
MLNSFLFATIAYLAFSAFWLTLDRSGALAALASATQVHLERVDFRSCALILGLTHVSGGSLTPKCSVAGFDEKSPARTPRDEGVGRKPSSPKSWVSPARP